MGFFTSHVLQRVFSGLGRIWQPLVMGHQPDLTAARRCYFDGAGNDATTTNSLTQPKKAFRRILLSSFPSSWTEFTPSSYPLYSATTDGPAIRHNHLYDDAMPRPRFSLPGAGWSGGGGVERAWGRAEPCYSGHGPPCARSQASSILMAAMARKQNLATLVHACSSLLPPSHPQATRFLNPPTPVYLSLLRPAV